MLISQLPKNLLGGALMIQNYYKIPEFLQKSIRILDKISKLFGIKSRTSSNQLKA